GNVGIGTAHPDVSLGIGSTSQFKVSSAGAVTAVGITNSNAYTQSGTNANTLSGPTTVSAANDALLVSTGNVGIGTAHPDASLGIGSTSQFKVTSAGAITGVGIT